MNAAPTLFRYFDAGQAGLVLTSFEPECVFQDLVAETIRRQKSPNIADRCELLFWDTADGLTDHLGGPIQLGAKPDNAFQDEKPFIHLHDALSMILQTCRDRLQRGLDGAERDEDGMFRILIVRNFDRMLSPGGSGSGVVDAALLQFAQKIIDIGTGTSTFLVLQCAPGYETPAELREHCEYVEHRLPDTEERADVIIDRVSADIAITPQLLNATAGLSRAKTAQYVAEAVSAGNRTTPPNPLRVFRAKAMHLSRDAKLDIWSPEFATEIPLRPVSSVIEANGEMLDLVQVREETHETNSQLSTDEIRVRVRFTADGRQHEKWLDPMLKSTFEAEYRPVRDFYSFNSIVGLAGLKRFLHNGFRPNVPARARLKHVLMLGVPGTGKSFTMQCTSGQFGVPLSSMQAANLYSKWLGDTDKLLAQMLQTVQTIGGLFGIDEFQRFLPQGGSNSEAGGVENRMLGTLLTWFNNQNSNLVLSAANNISHLPDEVTRSGRVDALMFVGFPSRQSKDAAWKMYLQKYELDADQGRPADDYWTPADIMSCCRLAELQQTTIQDASRWVTPSWEKNQKQMEDLMRWAEGAGCVCAETGERYRMTSQRAATQSSATQAKVARKMRRSATEEQP